MVALWYRAVNEEGLRKCAGEMRRHRHRDIEGNLYRETYVGKHIYVGKLILTYLGKGKNIARIAKLTLYKV